MKYKLILLISLLGFSVSAQEKVTLESLRDLPLVGSPVLSPDGNYLLFTVTRTNVPENSYDQTLFLLDLTTNLKHELMRQVSDAQWSPDGRFITYRASYSGKFGLYKAEVKMKGKKASVEPAVFLAEIHNSNHFMGHSTKKNYQWSPDGQYIAFVSADPATCRERATPNDPLVVERTLYKSRTEFSDNCLTRVYLIDKDGRSVKMLTEGPYDSHSLSWSPDSRYVAFLSNRTENPDHNYNNDLWKVDIQTLQITRLTNSAGTEHDPQWSPKGNRIAYPATKRPVNTKDSPPENTFIYALSDDGKTEVNLTLSLDRRASSPQWHPDGEWLYFTARNEGRTTLFRLKEGQAPEAVIDERGSVGSVHIGKDRIVYSYSDATHPAEIFTANPDGTGKTQVTFETATWVSKHQLSKTEDFWFESFDGTRVQGFIAYPAGITSGGKLPVIHRIHGGPHGMFGFSFTDINELLVSAGYAVVFINPRGSTGYGQKFADGTYQAWGGADYKDLMAGMDAALEKYPFLDKDRMGVTGGSYGGFMTNWVVTQTDRYKAAVTVASLSNLISFYGTSLYQLLIETEFNGLPWDNYNLLWHFSPLAHVRNVKTPTLLLHGENDIDVPITQAEEFYIALRKLGVPTRFVRYPNEGHGVRQPQHREHFNRELMNWFANYVPVKP